MDELLHSEQPDIVLCQETKLDCHISSSELFPVDFTIFPKDRNNSRGGVCIAANRNLQVAHCPDLEVNDLEAVWAQVHTRHHNPVYICSVYRPSDKGPDYIELLRQLLEVLQLYNWSLTWQMVFNTKKCHILSILRKRDRPTITYTLGTEKLSVVESYPYLAVTVSSDL